MKKIRFVLLSAIGLLIGCAALQPETQEIPSAVVTRTRLPVKLDGNLDESAWQGTPGYELIRNNNYSNLPPLTARRIAADLYEKAVVKFLYDDQYLYVGCSLSDSDVVAYGETDQDRLFRWGDLLEIFLYSADGGWYWEFYGAPNNRKSCFFYPGGGMNGVWYCFSSVHLMEDMKIAARVSGTINDHSNIDKGWNVEMRIPLREIAAKGIPFAPGQNWRIMAARYNFGARLTLFQNATWPKLPVGNFHLREYFAPVVFR